MKVQEMIRELQKLPPDVEVYLWDWDEPKGRTIRDLYPTLNPQLQKGAKVFYLHPTEVIKRRGE